MQAVQAVRRRIGGADPVVRSLWILRRSGDALKPHAHIHAPPRLTRNAQQVINDRNGLCALNTFGNIRAVVYDDHEVAECDNVRTLDAECRWKEVQPQIITSEEGCELPRVARECCGDVGRRQHLELHVGSTCRGQTMLEALHTRFGRRERRNEHHRPLAVVRLERTCYELVHQLVALGKV